MNQIVLQLDPRPGNARNSEAAFITLKSGRILMVWSKFITEDSGDWGGAVLAARHSDDGGLTWSQDDEVVVPQEGEVNVMSPSLLRLRDGRIMLLYLRKDRGPAGTINCMPKARFSSDEGESFSDPISLVEVPGYYIVNNDRLIQTRSGRIIAPCALHRFRLPSEVKLGEKPEGYFADPGLIYFFFSDDGGQTWLESLTSHYHCDQTGHGLQEPGALELDDGRLWSWTRTAMKEADGNPRQWQSFSADDGQVWSEPEPSEFVSSCSPMSIKRIPKSGDLLAVWNDLSGHFKVEPAQEVSWGRTPLVCAISHDDGKTWQHHKLLEDAPDHGFCYIAIHFTDDAVLLAYCAGGASSESVLDTLRVRRISLDELYQ